MSFYDATNIFLCQKSLKIYAFAKSEGKKLTGPVRLFPNFRLRKPARMFM